LNLAFLGFILITFASQSIWVTFSPVVTNVAKELGVPSEFIGYLAVLYPLFFLLLTVPSGILLDRKFRFWISFGAFMTFLGGFGRIFYRNYEWIFICQLFAALGQPFLLNGFVPFSSRLGDNKRTILISILVLSMYLGAISALVSGYYLYMLGGLELLVLPSAAVSALGFSIFLLGILNFPENRRETRSLGFGKVVKRRDLWLLGCILGLGVASFDNLATWLQPALENVKLGEIAGSAAAIAILSGLIGISVIPDMISRRSMRTTYIRLVIPIVVFFFTVLAAVQDRILIFSLLSISGLLMLPVYPIIMDWIGKFYEKEIQGSATGFVGLVSRVFSVSMMFLAPLFIKSASMYFSFLAIIVSIALVASIFVPKDRSMGENCGKIQLMSRFS